jgi:hypothetical protein
MVRISTRSWILSVLTLFTEIFLLVSVASSQERVFTNPTWQGMAVDRCLRWDADCEKAAADYYCTHMNYSFAKNFEIAPRRPTIVMLDNKICDGDYCRGFAEILCGVKQEANPPEQYQRPGGEFVENPQGSPARNAVVRILNPKLQKDSIDWCLHWGTECGMPAANRYCELAGYANAVDFRAGPLSPTLVLGDQKFCNGAICNGFLEVRCTGDKYFGGGAKRETNLALNRPAKQSSIYDPSNPRDPLFGVDGNKGTGFHTALEDYPWWEVDLGALYSLTEIRLYNRQDCCRERARTLKVLLSNDDRTWRMYYSHDGSVFGDDGRPLILPVNSQSRYVRIQLNERNYLHLAEVEIYGVLPEYGIE